MKTIMKTLNAFLVISVLAVLASCNNSGSVRSAAQVTDPFSNGGDERNMIVVISDIHLGADTSYSECVDNRDALVNLLKKIEDSENVKELVIAGDLIDEWFVPATVDTYGGKDQAYFVQLIANANKEVFEALNSIIKNTDILVTYVPGNHDLTVTAENIDLVLPGINQARDSAQGLGTYSPADYPQIAIEHGHRYNFFCAPDPISNQKIAPGTILPPGYFFTRIAALYVQQNNPSPEDVDSIPEINENPSWDHSQKLLYKYWKDWAMTLKMFPLECKFSDKIIVTNVNGFEGNYSVDDLLPYLLSAGGMLDVIVFKGIQDNWIERQKLNNVAKPIDTGRAIDSVMTASETDRQSDFQYFSNPESGKRLVVFGHTHDAKIKPYINNGLKSVYANSGTWIDNNNDLKTRTFVVITPQNANDSTNTYVKLYYVGDDGTVQPMSSDSLRY